MELKTLNRGLLKNHLYHIMIVESIDKLQKRNKTIVNLNTYKNKSESVLSGYFELSRELGYNNKLIGLMIGLQQEIKSLMVV